MGLGCRLVLENQVVVEVSKGEWEGVLGEILERKGYGKETEIEKVVFG